MGKRRKRTQRYLDHQGAKKQVPAPAPKPAATPPSAPATAAVPEPKIAKADLEEIVKKKIEQPSVAESAAVSTHAAKKAKVVAPTPARRPRRKRQVKAKGE